MARPFLAVFTALLASPAFAAMPAWNLVTADVFKQRLDSKEQMLVAFVAPEDELSSALLPHWKELEESLDFTAAVNCTNITTVCSEAKVATLPAVRLYRHDGSMVRYRGPRKAIDIALFTERMSRPLITELTNEQASDFSAVDDITVIGQFSDESQAIRDEFTDTARRFQDRYSFGILPAQDSPASNHVVCRNNLDDLEYSIQDLSQVGAMEQLLEKCAAPLVVSLTRRNELAFNKIAKSAVYYFSDDEADRLAYVDMIRPIAKMFNEYLVFATVDTNEYPQMPGTFGLGQRGLCLQVLQNGQVYHFNDELTAAGVQQFIQTVSGGKAQPWDGRSRSSSSHDEL